MAAKNRFNHIDCLAAALPDEEYFVLLARDPAFPAMLGIWASLRVGNVQAATENFTLLCSPELMQHYMRHPDLAKSEEAIQTANRGADWRAENMNGPNGIPTWKSSLVRPQMMQVDPYKAAADKLLGTEPAEGEREVGKHPALAAPYTGGQEICPVCQEFTCECEEGEE